MNAVRVSRARADTARSGAGAHLIALQAVDVVLERRGIAHDGARGLRHAVSQGVGRAGGVVEGVRCKSGGDAPAV